MNFSGKNILITGAARGIGFACAKAFILHGANVCLSDIDKNECKLSAEKMTELGEAGNVLSLTADVSSPSECQNLVDQCSEQLGQIDIFVNNAGIAIAGDILNLDIVDFDRLMGINLRGAFLMAQAVARSMVAAKSHGSIINMSSVNSLLALPNQIAYSISKGGLAQMTRAMSIRLAEENIRVNAIGPGSIATELLMEALSKDPLGKNAVLSRTPLGRLGEPSEIADIALYLASDYSSYITGETIYADGGRLALGYTVKVKDR